MNLTPLVTNTVNRIGDMVPLSPMAKLEIDGVLTALCEVVRAQALAEAAQVADEAASVPITIAAVDAPDPEFLRDLVALVSEGIADNIRALT